MSKFICSINGVRGRKIDIFDNKCIITTGVTVGSIISNNATDGEKTVFYIDVTGVQFKESGLTIGYLQLETPNNQMNNKDSNFFSENTFTFENNNEYMRRVYEFIVDRIEGYKYGTIDEAPTNISKHSREEKIELEIKEREERLHREAELKKVESEKKLKEMIDTLNQENSMNDIILAFVNQVSKCDSIMEIFKFWNQIPGEYKESYSVITDKLEKSVKNERLYGRDEKGTENIIKWIKEMFSV